MSGSAFTYFALTEGDHMKRMQNCSKTNDMKMVVKYLKTTETDVIAQCGFETVWGKTLKPNWTPTIEKPNTVGAFITQSPDDIYNSDSAPVMDTMFSITNQVSFFL